MSIYDSNSTKSAITRLVGAILFEAAVQRSRYVTLDMIPIAHVADDPVTGLPVSD